MADAQFASFEAVFHGVHDWTVQFPVEWGVSGTRSNILAAVTELDPNGLPFIGAASIQVLNIAPVEHGARVRVNAQWDSDIHVRLALVIWP
jgi:hypothetical protein